MTDTGAAVLIFDRMLVENEWMVRVKRQLDAVTLDETEAHKAVLADMSRKWSELFDARTELYTSLTDKLPFPEDLERRLVWMTEVHGDVSDIGDFGTLSNCLPPAMRKENALITAVLYAMRPIIPAGSRSEDPSLGLLFFQASQLVSLRMGLYSDLRRQLKRTPAPVAPVTPSHTPALWEYRFMIRMHDDIFSTEKPKEKTPE